MRTALRSRCASEGSSLTSPFGSDPTFNPGTSQYRATNFWGDYYARGDLQVTGLPYCFFYDGGRGGEGVRDYPIVFDVNANATRAYQLLRTVAEGRYMDEGTETLRMRLLLYNGETDAYTKLRSAFRREPSGLFTADHEATVLRVYYYDWTFWFVFRACVEATWVLALGCLLIREVADRAAQGCEGGQLQRLLARSVSTRFG